MGRRSRPRKSKRTSRKKLRLSLPSTKLNGWKQSVGTRKPQKTKPRRQKRKRKRQRKGEKRRRRRNGWKKSASDVKRRKPNGPKKQGRLRKHFEKSRPRWRMLGAITLPICSLLCQRL